MSEVTGRTRRQVLAGVATAVTLAATPAVAAPSAASGPAAGAQSLPALASTLTPARERGPVELRRARIAARYGLDAASASAAQDPERTPLARLLDGRVPDGRVPDDRVRDDRAAAWQRVFTTVETLDELSRTASGARRDEALRRQVGALKRSRDRQVLALAKAGEPHAMELFHLWRAPDLLRLLGKPHARAPEDVEDVAQTAWERFWAELVSGEAAIADPFSYLVQIARNHAADLWRHHQGPTRDPGHLVSLHDALGADGGWRLEDVVGAEDERARWELDCEGLVDEARAHSEWCAAYVEESIKRALGLPARSLTELASAHGMSKSRAYRLLEAWRAEHAPRYLDAP